MSTILDTHERDERTGVTEASPRTADRLGRTGRINDLLFYAWIAVVTSLATIPLLDLRRASLTIPFEYGGDALYYNAHFKNILERGWYESNPALGAPFGQVHHDFSVADNLHMVAARGLGLLTDEYGLAFNLYYLLGFPLAALTAAWFVRLVGGSRSAATVVALLFAFAPYHFLRGEGHLFLAAYYPVPLALGLVYLTIAGRPLWSLRSDRAWYSPARWVTAQSAGTVAILVVLGSASSYYALFTLFLLAFAGFVALVRDRRLSATLGAVTACVGLVAVMVANMAPDILYERTNGKNPIALTRYPFETEVYALKLSSMLLPSPRHRIDGWAAFRQEYDRYYPLPGESATLGVVASVGLVLLIVVACASIVAIRRTPGTGASRDAKMWATQRHLAALAVFSLLLGSIGGFSSLFSLFVSDEIRGWNRLSIFIALLSLTAVGLLLDLAGRRLRRLRPGSAPLRVLGLLVLALLLLGGLWEQGGPQAKRDYEGTAASFASDADFVQQVERRLAPGSMVFQLPYHPFPESPPRFGMLDYDELRPYLHSTSLRWSYGGVKGRPEADWAAQVARLGTEEQVALATNAGFTGLTVDRFGYEDRATSLERDLRAVLVTAPLTSEDGRFSFWPLEGYGESLRAAHSPGELDLVREATLQPAVAYIDQDDWEIQAVNGPSQPSSRPDPEIFFDSTRSDEHTVRVFFTLSSRTGTSGATVTWPDGRAQDVDLRLGPVDLSRTVVVEPGRSVMRLQPSGGAQSAVLPQDVRFEITPLVVTDPVIEAFVP